ncbi:MAG TPA: methyl-accepting chemotaxis protein [Spirochaetota bacterium]|nr:methyl-accepting chemotaxis protein [Spirochaetota bacterium]
MAKKKQKTLQLEKNQLFAEVLTTNNRRLIYSILSIFLLANVATIAIKLSGKGSAYLSLYTILIEFILIIAILSFTLLLARIFSGKKISSYTTITGIMLCLWVFQYVIYGATELFAVNYIALGLSVFYFNWRNTLYTLFLVIITQTTLFILRPELVPGGPASNVIVRYLVYIWVSIGATAGAEATKKILMLAILKNEEANRNSENLQVVAGEVLGSIAVLKNQTGELHEVSETLRTISQDEAASLEQVSASTEELSASSDALSGIAKSLNSELDINRESVSDLEAVNIKMQNDARQIYTTLGQVADYSKRSADQIVNTKEEFNTLKEKSIQMSNFIDIINDIADKVNLLSLNAAIEAARAGEYGRGFAVVADEISKLADATTMNSKEIARIISENHTLIDNSSAVIETSVGMINDMNTAVVKIKEEIGSVATLMEDIDRTIMVIKKLNDRIHDSSRIIENSTSEQKFSTDELSKTTYHISTGSQKIVEISNLIYEAIGVINFTAEKLDDLSSGMVKIG